MKSKLLRLIASILIIASLVSMFAVFAAAETSEEETEETAKPSLEVLYNRTYDEGWDLWNGASKGNVPAGGYPFTFEYETDKDYNYNYFFRFTVESANNVFAEFSLGNNNKVGSVIEFDMKTDDWTNIGNLMHFGTAGSPSSARNNYNLISVYNNQVYFHDVTDVENASTVMSSTPAFDLTNDWMHVAIVFDYEYDSDGNPETPESTYFKYSIYYGSTEEYHKTGNLTLYKSFIGRGKGSSGNALQLLRINHTTTQVATDRGTSICFDNMQIYSHANQYGQVAVGDSNKGIKVNSNYSKTIEILTNDSGTTKTNADYLNECYALKLNVDYAYGGNKYNTLENKDDRTPLRTSIIEKDGEVWGAPFMDENGVIWVALEPILDYAGYPVYKHEDGIFVDISTGTSSSFISTQSTTATVGGQRIDLLNAPRYYYPDGDEDKKYLAINLYDLHTILPEYYVDYDDMGLIVISQSSDPNIIDRNLDIHAMMNLMKAFVFNYASPEEILDNVRENTNNFTHPYLHATQDTFDNLREIFYAKEGDEKYDEEIQNYILRLIWDGFYALAMYGNLDENGNYLGLKTMEEQLAWYQIPSSVKFTNITDIPGLSYSGRGWTAANALNNYISNYGLVQPYYSDELGGQGNGYDTAGGRSNVAGRTAYLEKIAFAYQITRDERLLYVAYDIAIELGKWEHWGPGHFLNCADGSAPFSTYLDWCYNGYVDLYNSGETKYDVTKLEQILYVKGVLEGVLSTHGAYTEYTSPPVGAGGSLYPSRENNWNAVCTAGMVSSALAILGSELTYDYTVFSNKVEYVINGSISDWSAWLISSNIKTLMEFGMGQYAPEGAYIESPGYWEYGTNNFFELCSALKSASGTDYGLMDCWGIDQTCYFAVHTESSDFKTFNFHDGSMGQQNSSMFFFVADHFGDETLAKVRLAHMEGGKNISMMDLFYYPMGELQEEEMSYDYFSKQLDLYCARSSWEKGALYVGMMGGINKLGHGQIDAGSFVYHNAGTVWIIDLGTENYNSAGFWPEATRYRYYVMKPEGNNTITLVSDPLNVPYGQDLNSTAPMILNGSNEHGSFMALDMTSTLKGNATTWTRGMMVTNDRKTTVIQDEIYFEGVQEAYWFAHVRYGNGYLKDNGSGVTLSADKRTAYLRDTNGNILRMKIESSRPDLKFEIMDTYTFVHTTGDSATFGPEYSATTPNAGGQIVPENSRKAYGKLAIHIPSTPSIAFAVIIEVIEADGAGNYSTEIEKGYSYTPIFSWEPYADTRERKQEAVVETIRKAPVISNIRSFVNKVSNLVGSGRAYTYMVEDFYMYLADIYYIKINFYPDELAPYKSQLDEYEAYKAEYDKFISTINNRVKDNKSLVYKLSSI